MADTKTGNAAHAARISGEVQNIGDAAEEELGYIKSILWAIQLMAEQDARCNKLEIVSLAKCAHWIANNLESNVDYMGARIIEVSREIH